MAYEKTPHRHNGSEEIFALMFDGIVMNFGHALLLLAGVVVMVAVMKANREEDDEMSAYNYMKAKAKTRDLMHIVYKRDPRCSFRTAGVSFSLGSFSLTK